MSFATSPFGNGTLVGSGGNVTSNVHTNFGTRKAERAVGRLETDGITNELSIEITGVDVTAAGYPLIAPSLPAGAVIEKVFLKVKEAFVLGGTTPAIEIGTEGSEATNGFTITEAQAEATGTYDVTSALSGTWASPLAAATTVGLLLSGTNPTVTSAGKLEAVIRYSVV